MTVRFLIGSQDRLQKVGPSEITTESTESTENH
jgi:hypothetical protein